MSGSDDTGECQTFVQRLLAVVQDSDGYTGCSGCDEGDSQTLASMSALIYAASFSDCAYHLSGTNDTQLLHLSSLCLGQS